ncbi:MAG: hypothetical protein ABW098_03355 [Candidatus Thiodiazotropha sp.]
MRSIVADRLAWHSKGLSDRADGKVEFQLKFALLGKIAFWLIVVGAIALLTPQPAWPEWLARMVLSTGIALGVTTLGISLWRKRGGD